jgi:hypothetical protein
MPRPKAPEGDRKGRNRKTRKTGENKNGAASSRATAPSEGAPMEPTVETLIDGLEKARRLAIEHNRATTTVNATVAIARLMPQSKTPGGDRKRRGRKTREADAEEDDAASCPATAPSEDAPMELTVDALIKELDKVRRFAIKHNRFAAAVNATVAIARLLRLLPDTPGRPPSSPSKRGQAPQYKFDGNYHEAARRIALLLQLGKKKADGAGDDEAGKGDGTDT